MRGADRHVRVERLLIVYLCEGGKGTVTYAPAMRATGHARGSAQRAHMLFAPEQLGPAVFVKAPRLQVRVTALPE